MKRVVTQLLGTAGLLLSGSAMAHVGSHGSEGVMATLMHMLADHGYLLAIVAAVFGIRHLLRNESV